jgi:microcystin-dependent protein
MDRGLHVEGKLFDEVGMVSPEVGDIKMSVREDNYEGWLVCDGRAISRETYSALFALIGTTFGSGDGLTTFNIPNGKGRIPLGAQSSSGTGYYCVGNTGGEETHTLNINEMPSHNHSATDSGHTHSYVNQAGDVNVNTLTTQDTAADQVDYNQTSGTGYANITIGYTGQTQPHNNMQPYWVFGNYFIYSGVKDSRKEGCNDSFPIQPCND